MLSAAQHTQAAASAHARRLQATNVIPVISVDVAAKRSIIPTDSLPLSLNDMICAVKSYSPTGLTGMLMP
jgi:hypothetical protein